MYMIRFLFFSVCLIALTSIFAQNVVRGPYMQTQTNSSIIFKWRTDIATASTILYGAAPNSLTQVSATSNGTDHTIELTGLQAYTKYYYAVGGNSGIIAGADSNHYFITAPLPYTEQPIRVWATGDFGKGNQCQIDVKQSFESYTRNQNIDPDLWIWLGDNAYDDGKDNEYQAKVFALNGYSDIFSWMPFYPSPGNHDYGEVWSDNGVLGIPYTITSIGGHDGPYYDLVDVPEQAEAGGFPSTHEVFYSYDYGNTHFLSLNSEVFAIGSNTVLNQMITFINNDLAQNDKDWVIAYWHQPPYSKGSHDSDDFYELVMQTMREDVVPVLEQFDIDMIICGHSHVYERSYLLHGHYGQSNSLTAAMILDSSNGNRAQGNAYVKNPSASVPQGTVYSVVGNAGSSEDTIFGSHPVMASSYTGSGNCGSLILDIYKNELRGRHLTIQGTIIDDFSLVKQNMSMNLGNDTLICQHDSITLSPAITKGSDTLQYLWTPGNFTTREISVSPNSSTTYTLTITDEVSGQIISDQRIVNVAPIPQSVVIQETNGILSVTAGYTYRWFRDGVLIPSANSSSYNAAIQGEYQVEISNASGCTMSTDLLVYYDLEIDIIADKDAICIGDSVILFLSVNGGSDSTQIQWVNVSGSFSSFYYTPTVSQDIIADGTDFTTNEYESDTLNLTVHLLPVVNSVVQNGNILSVDFFPNWNYAWYRNGSLIPNSNNADLSVTENGDYSVEVVDENGCKTFSAVYNYTGTGIRENKEAAFFLFPNPNNGKFTLKTSEKILSVEIYNYEGKLIYKDNGNNKNISLENLAFGAYIVEMKTAEKIYTQQFIIE